MYVLRFVFFALPSNTKTNFIAEIQLRKHKIKKTTNNTKNKNKSNK